MDRYTHIQAHAITVNVGAEISGIDLRQLNPNAEAELKKALIDRKVLVIRNQE
ncbi:MAG: hypothetical protein CFH10_02119, partial [Alphaproteobacteria bacterium MarineAlpha4_Bin2]